MKEKQKSQSIRPEEQSYQEQIRNTYKNYPHLFITYSSDLLHLEVKQKISDGETYQCLVAKSNFKKFDIIAEVRGSIISYSKLRKLIEEKTILISQLPLLLYLNFEQKLLLSPKNISKYLFTNSSYKKANELGNCYIENHFGSKLLAIASKDIQIGEQFILQHQSYIKSIYRYSPDQF